MSVDLTALTDAELRERMIMEPLRTSVFKEIERRIRLIPAWGQLVEARRQAVLGRVAIAAGADGWREAADREDAADRALREFFIARWREFGVIWE